MLTEERFRAILDILSKKNAVTVSELTQQLGASESTIRRDLTALHRQGMLLKVHGGATALTGFLSHDNDMSVKHNLNIEEKRAVAAYAAGLIENGDVVFLDAGSTTVHLPDYLKATDITFVTNGLAHARNLVHMGYTVITLGGTVNNVTEAIAGDTALDTLRHFNFTKGFFGVNGISIAAGYTTPSLDEAAVKSEAMKRCQSCYVLADSDKFGKVATMSFSPLEEASIITAGNRNLYSAYAEHTMIIEVKKL